MTNHDLTTDEVRPSFCPQCGEDFGVAVNEDDEAIIFCKCSWHFPEEFVEELEEELPMDSESPDSSDGENSNASKGFQ